MRWMNLKPVAQSEINQKEINQITYINACIWNLEKWYWRIYLQSSNGKIDIENRLMDMGGAEEGEVEMYGDSNMETSETICEIEG